MPSEKRQRQRENAAARQAAIRVAQQRRANRRRGLVGGVALVAVIAIIALFVAQTTSSKKKTPAATAATTTTVAGTPPVAAPAPAGATITGATPCPNFDGSSPRTLHFAQAPPTCIDPGKHYTATFNTTLGDVVVALDTPATAGTVNNFVTLALYHYYDKTSFDRIDTSIDIIQGGSPTTQSISDPGPGYTIHDEPGAQFNIGSDGQLHGPYNTYSAGDLVMARGSGRNSGAAQYFFVYGPAAQSLATGGGPYVTFGHVTSGLDVLQKAAALYEACPASDQTCLGGAPSKVVLVNSVTIQQTS